MCIYCYAYKLWLFYSTFFIKSNWTHTIRILRSTNWRVMAKCEMKKNVTILMIIILVVAQADDSPSPSSPPHQTIGEIICLGKCALKCKRFFRIKPLYAGCVASCALLKCHKVSSKVAYDCATNCVISKSNNFNTGNYIFSIVLYDFFCYQDNFINYCCIN